ncbi:MAG TPA: metallophosphoesterase family protein [bacterium]|nr:metallophosphoesterase family protein [bacterium]
MKYAIVSDIHANLEALEAALAEIRRIGPDKVFCLGDLVGYGASPGECIEAARPVMRVTVAGNHDHGAAGLTDIRYFNSYARHAVMWTAAQLSREHLAYLAALPLLHVEGSKFRIVHATPSDPGQWNYIFTREQARAEFKAFPEQICFVGHSHQAGIFEMGEDGTVHPAGDHIKVLNRSRYMVNVGSIGQPRDGDPRGCICVYDEAASEIAMIRVAYDVAGAQKRIIAAGLPPILAQRLSYGE